ncbi:MAG: hypothetical protein ABIJ97_17725 [Bacteroidota bacterium]
MKRLVLIAFLLLSISYSIRCQVKINYSDNEILLLEQLVKNNIDLYRKTNGLDALWNDSILYHSAKEHAVYIKSTGSASIFEPVRKLGTPQKRCEAKGAVNYNTSEIISVINIDSLSGLEKMADLIFDKLLSDAVNIAHILCKTLKIQGLTLTVSKDSAFFIAVQDIASVDNNYVFKKLPSVFPFDTAEIPVRKKNLPVRTKYDWKLQSPKSEENCKNINGSYNRLKNISIEENDDRLMLIFDKEATAKQLLIGKKDGLAIEVVDYESYLCDRDEYFNQPSRRNNLSLLNGELMKPLYTEGIIRESGYIDETEERYVRSLGNIRSKSEYFEANAVLIENNKVCKVLGQSKICGQTFRYSVDKIEYLDNFKLSDYEPKVTYDTLKIKIFYKPNQTEPDMTEIQPILNFVKKEGLIITKATVNSNASVEGSKQINEMIFNQRADYLLGLFEKEQTYEIRKTVTMQENWSLFYSQIRGTRYSFLEFVDTLVARKYVNDSIEYFVKQLDDQRYSTVNLFAVTKATRDQYKVYAINDFKKIQESIVAEREKGNEKTIKRLVNEAKNIQLYLYEQYRSRQINDEFIRILKIPDDEIFTELQVNELIFKYKYQKKPGFTDLNLYDGLQNYALSPYATNIVFYNILAYLVNHYGEESVNELHNSKYISSLIEKTVGENISADDISSFNLHFNYLKTIELYDENKLSKAGQYLNGMYSYYLKYKCDTNLITSLAEYFILFREYKDAYKIASSLVKTDNFNNYTYALYLKMHYMEFWKEKQSTDYYQLLFNSEKYFTNDEWCSLFEGKCGISFQIFDYEPLWRLFCLKKNG